MEPDDDRFYHNYSSAELGQKTGQRDPWHVGDETIAWSARQVYHGRVPETEVQRTGWYRITLHDAHAVNTKPGEGIWCTVLRGAGLAVGLPFLDAMVPAIASATESESPRRFVAFSLGLGLHGPNLFPQESGFHYAPSPYLAEISDILPDLTVCSGVSHPQVAGGHRAENGSMIPPETSPSRLFQQLFIDDAPAAKQQDSARLRHGRRVMDLVAAPSQRTAA